MKYILAEFPDVSIPEAMKISMKITKGYKWDLFIMYLSFLGWMILSSLTFGIGFLWLFPYMNLSFANAYKFLLGNALNKNRITMEELYHTQGEK